MCTYKGRNIHTQSFHQIYKDAHTPDSSVTVELGALTSFPQLQFTVNGCRKVLKHKFVISICAPRLSVRPVSEKNGISEALQQCQSSCRYTWLQIFIVPILLIRYMFLQTTDAVKSQSLWLLMIGKMIIESHSAQTDFTKCFTIQDQIKRSFRGRQLRKY